MISDFEKIVLLICKKNEINLERIRAYNKWNIAKRKKEKESILKELFQEYKKKSKEGKVLFAKIRPIKKDIGAKFLWDSSGYCTNIILNDLVIKSRYEIEQAATDIECEAILLGKEIKYE